MTKLRRSSPRTIYRDAIPYRRASRQRPFGAFLGWLVTFLLFVLAAVLVSKATL